MAMKLYLKIFLISLALILIITLFLFSKNSQQETQSILRESKIPVDAVKMTPATDENNPISLSSEYENPAPLPAIINTAGAEDSPFITSDGNTLYFFFTPDVNIPVEKQILDGVTGIYVSQKSRTGWTPPKRVFLNEKNKLSLDGCEFVDDKIMLFCSAREGYEGMNWFSAEFKDGKWISKNKKIEFPLDYQVGELHEYNDELYFHSSRSGGKGGLDIWIIKRNSDRTWTTPENIEAINSANDEGWPALSPDGDELWFSKDYAIWRSKKINNEWSQPEKIFSPLAGEPSIDIYGNVYFVHHFFKDGKMIEADIYFAKKK